MAHVHRACKGVPCDICTEKDCEQSMQTVEGLRLCPLCFYRLNR